MKIPRFLLRHTITVEPYLGAAGDGPVYGPPRQVRCHLQASRRAQRQPARGGARITTDVSTAYCSLDDADVLTPEARVTVAGRVVEVVSVRAQTFPGGPTPDHLEVTFL